MLIYHLGERRSSLSIILPRLVVRSLSRSVLSRPVFGSFVVLFGRRLAWLPSRSVVIVCWVYRRLADDQAAVLHRLGENMSSLPHAHLIQFVLWQLNRATAVNAFPDNCFNS